MNPEKPLLDTHRHPLTLVAGQSECKACSLHTKSSHYYHCYTCESRNVSYHEECITYSSEITHPYHPIHPLQICTRRFAEVVSKCFWCNGYMGSAFYRCSICDLNIHLFCASQPQLVLTLDAGSYHDHPLTIFPRKMYFACNLCGYFAEWFPIYACVQCDFMVHRWCLGLPSVIRISCHEHRISRRLYLPPGKRSCGVCYQEVDPRFGAFFCTKGSGYAVHSSCATSDGVWDKRELKDVAEDEDELKDVEPYKVIDENHIKHFSHDHNLRFIINHRDDKRRRCRACNFLIQIDNFYKCDSCDFTLHEGCANLLRKRWYMLYRYPLTLKSDDDITLSRRYHGRRGFFFCSTCTRFSCGFRYVCEIEHLPFEVDVRCASIARQLKHKNHPHPLFVRLINNDTPTCVNCQKASKFVFSCLQCPNYNMCFKCATLPDEVVYKHDKHPLILCCGEDEVEGQYWCETCETELEPKEWFYKCDECCVTLHIPCLLGTSPYAKPGPIMIKASRLDEESETICHEAPPNVLQESWVEFIPIRPEEEFDIIANETLSRPLCCHCRRRCPDAVAFKQKQDFYCSVECICQAKSYNDLLSFFRSG